MAKVHCRNYFGTELELLQRFAIYPYVFSLVSPQWTIIGIEPEEIIRSWKGVEEWFSSNNKYVKSRVSTIEQKLPFTHGLIGYISYEQGYKFLNYPAASILNQIKKDHLTLPNVYFGKCSNLVLLNKQQGKLYILYKNKSFLNDVEKTLNAPLPSSILPPPSPLLSRRVIKTQSSQYNKAFHAILHHIKQGDIYQLNLSHRLTAPFIHSAFKAFHTLYTTQPTNYSAFIQSPSFGIASNSPELFLKITNRQSQRTVETHPMKGTRPRGKTAKQDKALYNNLLNSTKDKAELDMIIDLHRNDLNQTAIPGSTQVIERRRINQYASVWQADAVIKSQIAKPYTTLDVIKKCFPAGSITGVPKIRAMEIIHELEPTQRNVYTGSIGFIDSSGNAEFNVAIRTAIIKDKKIHYQVGSGIVIDSLAEAEYQETLDKAKIVLNSF